MLARGSLGNSKGELIIAVLGYPESMEAEAYMFKGRAMSLEVNLES